MKTKTSLALMLAGILTVAGGWKLSNYHIGKSRELEQSLPARVYEIQDELLKITNLPSKEILDKVADPNNAEFLKDYKSLVKELDTYDPNMIANAFKGQEKYQGYCSGDGMIIATGLCLSVLGLNHLTRSYLDSRKKRKKSYDGC